MKTFLNISVYLVIAIFFFNNVAKSQLVYNNGLSFYLATGSVTQINGDLQNQTGTIKIDQENGVFAQLNINGNLLNNDNISAEGLINLNGNWINNDNFTADQGTVNLTNTNQIIGGSVETSFYNLDFTQAGIKTLENSQHILGVLDIGDSELKTGTHALYIDNTEFNSLVFNTGFVSSYENGFLQRSMLYAGQYTFPLGVNFNNPVIRKLVISPTLAETSKFNCRFVFDNPNEDGMYTSLLKDSISYINENWYHIINRIAGSDPVKMDIYYHINDGSYNKFANWKTSPSPAWYILKDSYSSNNNDDYLMTENIINDFSYPAFALCKNIIPDVDTLPEEFEAIIYNSFSPNGDGTNDTWVVENCPNCNVKIFNRNGNIVFQSDNNTIDWDGKFKDEKVPDATYYYIIQTSGATRNYKGSVTIIR